MFTEKTQKYPKFYCEKCDFITNNKKDYNRHILTLKHLNVYNCLQEVSKKSPKIVCLCGKEYSCRQSLYVHKKKCNIKNNDNNDNNNNNDNILEYNLDKNELIEYLIKENKNFKELLIEQNNKIFDICKNGTHNTINNTDNSNNSFNLNLFLNETCKGALNISEFIETIKVQLQDLENVGKLGYIEGISKIIIRGLKELDVTKRPIHCSDLKRETLYVKNDNIWENDKEKEKMKYTIQHIAGKNFKQIPIWVKENPLSKDSESKKHLEYMRIINKSTGGMTEEEDEQNYNKIIKRVANEVIINK